MLNHNHQAAPLPRTTSNSLRLIDGPKSLTFTASLDPRRSDASDIARAVDRGGLEALSIGFMVAPDGDKWSKNETERVILAVLRPPGNQHS